MKYIFSILMIASCTWAVSISVRAAVYWQAYGNPQNRDLCLILAFAMLLGVLMFTAPFVVRTRK